MYSKKLSLVGLVEYTELPESSVSVSSPLQQFSIFHEQHHMHYWLLLTVSPWLVLIKELHLVYSWKGYRFQQAVGWGGGSTPVKVSTTLRQKLWHSEKLIKRTPVVKYKEVLLDNQWEYWVVHHIGSYAVHTLRYVWSTKEYKENPDENFKIVSSGESS